MTIPMNGVIMKSHTKSKIKRISDDSARFIFNETKSRLTEDGEEIVLLQIMPLPSNQHLIEYVYKEDWDEELIENIERILLITVMSDEEKLRQISALIKNWKSEFK